MKEADIDRVVDFIDLGLKLSLEISAITGPKLVDFNNCLIQNAEVKAKVENLKEQVEKFSKSFAMPGYSDF